MIKKIIINVEDISTIAELTKVELLVIKELFKYVAESGDFKDTVILNSSIRRVIIDNINIKPTSLNNSLNNLCKKNILERLDTNMYKINKNIFNF